MEKQNTRKFWVDELRGLSMLVVVYGHCLLSSSTDYSAYFVFSSPLNVALFFAISSYLFKMRNGEQNSFYKYILFRLVIPWLALGLFPYYNITRKLPLLISGETLWFMPALIIAEIIWFYVRKTTKQKEMIAIIGLALSFGGLILFQHNLFNYAMINRALAIQWIFVIGFYIKEKETYLLSQDSLKLYAIPLLTLFVVLGGAFLLIYPGRFYDVHMNRYFFLPLSWSIIALGIILSFMIFANLKITSKVLILIGQNTLLIYMLHGMVRVVYHHILATLSVNCSDDYYPIMALIETCFACSICIALSLIANKYCPLIVGRKKIEL